MFALVATINDNTGSTFIDRVGTGFTGTGPNVTTANTQAQDAGTAGRLSAGTYQYKITFLGSNGVESQQSNPVSVTLVQTNHAVRLTNLPVDTTVSSTVVARRVYRTNDGGDIFYLVATINDNSTQEFIDRFGDSATANAPNVGGVNRMTATDGGAGGQQSAREYKYRITFLDSKGVESRASTPVAFDLSLIGAGHKIKLDKIPLGLDGTLARRIYRSNADGNTFSLIATLNDNTSQEFIDTVGDGAKGEAPNVITPIISATDDGAGGKLAKGEYSYRITFLDEKGNESNASDPVSATVADNNHKVKLENIPLGPEDTAARRIYRTAAGGTTFHLVATLNDNTSRTFTDTSGTFSIVTNGLAAPNVASAGTVARDDGEGGQLATGVYQYRISFVDNSGVESNASTPVSSPNLTAAKHKITLDLIPVGPNGTAARRIYRTAAGGNTFTLVATLNDNTTRSFTDTFGASFDITVSDPKRAPPPSGGTVALDGGKGGTLSEGVYTYRIIFVDDRGAESKSSCSISVKLASEGHKVKLDQIPTGPAGTQARRIYRTAANGDTFHFLATLTGNVETTFTDRDGLQGTEPRAKASGALFHAALTEGDNNRSTVAKPGSGKIFFQPGELKGGETERIPATSVFDIKGPGTTNKLVITAKKKPGVEYNDTAIRFVEIGTGTVSVDFRPLEGPSGTLVFSIYPTTTAAQIRDLLNNDQAANDIFWAEVRDATLANPGLTGLNKPLALFSPPRTSDGQDNSLVASANIGQLKFTEKIPDSLTEDVTIIIRSAVFQTTPIKVTEFTDSRVIIYYRSAFSPTVGEVVKFLGEHEQVGDVFRVAGLVSFTTTITAAQGTLQKRDDSNATAASAFLEFPGPNNDLRITAKERGEKFNNVQIAIANVGNVTQPDQVAVRWTPPIREGQGGLLTFDISAGTKANDLIAAMNRQANKAAADVFTVALDTTVEGTNTGEGLITLSQQLMKDGADNPNKAAVASVVIPGPHNDLKITAKNNGDIYNGAVSFINTGRSTKAEEVFVAWKEAEKVLVFNIHSDTTAQHLVDAMDGTKDFAKTINKAALDLFKVELLTPDSESNPNQGIGKIDASSITPKPGVSPPRWTRFGGSTLPHAVVKVISYTPPIINEATGARRTDAAGKPAGDVLVVGLLGRGAWKMTNVTINTGDPTKTIEKPNILTLKGTPEADQYILRLNPGRPYPLDPWIDVVRVKEGDGNQEEVIDSLPQAGIEEIKFDGLGGNDRLLVDSRIRIHGESNFDGGGGTNSLLILGAPGDSLISVNRTGEQGRILIGGGQAATDPTLSITFAHVDGLQTSIPGTGVNNLLAKFRAGLDFLETFQGIVQPLSDRLGSLPIVGTSLVRVLLGATGQEVQAVSDPVIPDPEVGEKGMNEGLGVDEGRFPSIIDRLFSDGLSIFSPEEIDSLSIPSLEALRQVLDDLDATEGNVTLEQEGDSARFDVTVTKTVTGVAALEIEEMDGALDLEGFAEMSIDVTLHIVIGVDEEGFYIDANRAGEPELILRNLQLLGVEDVTGTFGVSGVALESTTLTVDPTFEVAVDLLDPAADPFSEVDDGLIRPYEVEISDDDESFVAVDMSSADPAVPDVEFRAVLALGEEGSATTDTVDLVWDDIEAPEDITSSGGTTTEQQTEDIKSGLLTGLGHMADLGSNVGGGDAMNTTLPMVSDKNGDSGGQSQGILPFASQPLQEEDSGVSISDLVNIGSLLSLQDTVNQYFGTAEMPTNAGIAQAIRDKILGALGGGAQGTGGGGPLTVSGGYYEDTNELRFDIGMDFSQEFDFDLDMGSDFSNLGLTIEGDMSVRLKLYVKFDISFGLDMNNLLNGLPLNPAEDVFIKVGEARFGVAIALEDMNFTISADIGGATGTLEVVDGNITLDASVNVGFTDPDWDGKLRISQLSSILSIMTFEPHGNLEVDLPMSGSLTGPAFNIEGAMLLSVKPFDVFGGGAQPQGIVPLGHQPLQQVGSVNVPKFLLALEGSVDFSGFFYANGSFAFQTFDPRTVTLNDGTQVEVSLVTIGAQEIYGFAGVNGPYFTPADDLNGNGMVDLGENTNQKATGFSISGVEFAAAFMKTLPPVSTVPGVPPPIQTDLRSWTALRARVGDVRPVGLPGGITLAVQNLFVGINRGGGTNNGVPNTTVVDLAANPLDVRAGVQATDVITLNFEGSKGELIEAGGSVTLDVNGSFYVSGTMAFGMMTTTATLYDTVTKTSTPNVELSMLTVGAVGVDAFFGIDGPYWTDLDGSDTVNWTDPNGNVLDEKVADLNQNAFGLSLVDVDVGLVMMSTPPPAASPAAPPATADNRTWTTLKAHVGYAEFVGIDDLTIRAESLMVAVNLGGGAQGAAANTTLIDFASTPIEVNPSSDPNDKIVFDFAGTLGALIEAHGRLVLDLFGVITVSGNFAFVKRTEMVRLFNTETGMLDPEETEVSLITVGLSRVIGFFGNKGPYWVDLDRSGDISWVDKNGDTQPQWVADTNHNGEVDPDETEELSEEAVGLALSDINVALAVMSPSVLPPPASTLPSATATVVSPGPSNDLTFTATTAGPSFNDVTVEYVNGDGLNADYDPASKKLRIMVVPGVTKASDILGLFDPITPSVPEFTAAKAETGIDGLINTFWASTGTTGSASPSAMAAQATLRVPGENNDLTFTAKETGPDYNNVTIAYVNGDALGAEYRPANKRLIITVVPGETTAAEVKAKLLSIDAKFTADNAESGDTGFISRGIIIASAYTGSTGSDGPPLVAAQATLRMPGPDNDLTFTATTEGSAYNNVSIVYVNGTELNAEYNSAAKKLIITVIPGVTKAEDIIAKLIEPGIDAKFTAVAAEPADTGLITGVHPGLIDTAPASTGKTGNSLQNAEFARVKISSPGPYNDLTFIATTAGIAFNTVTVEYVSGTALDAKYDAQQKKLTITVVPDVTTAAEIITSMEAVDEFTAWATEGSANGVVRRVSTSSTGSTGRDETKASVTIRLPGLNNDLTFTAATPGAEFNEVTVEYVDSQGAEPSATYTDAPTKKLTIKFKPGLTKAADVITLLGGVTEFTAKAAESATDGGINLASGSTGSTGSDGEKAHVTISIPSLNNDLTFTAATLGTEFNDVTVELLNSGGNDPSAAYEGGTTKKLTIKIKDGITTAAEVIPLLAATPFTATAAESADTGVINIVSSGSTLSTGSDANIARAIVKSPGDNNDLKITATATGSDYSGVRVQYVSGTAAGASYDPITKVLTVTVLPGVTTAEQIIALVNSLPTFSAAPAEPGTNGAIKFTPAASTGSTGVDAIGGNQAVAAHATVIVPGLHNDLTFTATTAGAAFNDVTIKYVSGPTTSAAYDEPSKVLTITVNPGVTTARNIIDALGPAHKFAASPAETATPPATDAASGTISLPSASTGLTGGPLPPPQKDTRRWISLKAEVGGVEIVGIDGVTIRADELMVAINQGIGKNAADPLNPGADLRNKTVVDYQSNPMVVKTGIDETDTVTMDFNGENGNLLEASGHMTVSVMGFFHASGGFAFTKKTEYVNLYDTATGILDTTPTKVDTLTLGASRINAFAGVGGPYWIDLDHSGTVSWTDDRGIPLYEATADLNHDGIVDENETAELSEEALGYALVDVDFALAVMSAPPPDVPQLDVQQAAHVTMTSPGPSNDLTFTAAIAGAGFNQVAVEYVNSDHTEAVYDPVLKKLTISVIPGETTAAEVITLMNGVGEFTATAAEGATNGLINPGPSKTAGGADADGGNPAVAAHVTVISPGPNNDLTFEANTPGEAYNDVEVSFVNGTAAGVSYDSNAKKLTITTVPGVTTAAEIINLMFGQPFTATAAEGGSGGIIKVNTPPGTTGATGTGTAAAYATVTSPGLDNDLIFVGDATGAELNLVTVEYVNDPAPPTVLPQEPLAQAACDSTAKKLTVTVQPGVTKASDVIKALESVPEFSAIPGEGGTDGKINTAPGSTGSSGDTGAASVEIDSPGKNNNLRFTASTTGPAFNDVTIKYVHGTAAAAQYVASSKTLRITLVPGVTTAANVITLLETVPEFSAEGTEAGDGGVIDTAPASTHTTGGTAAPPPPVDKRKWLALKASVGSVGVVGIPDMNVEAESLMVAINERFGKITGVPGPPEPGTTIPTLRDLDNTAMVDFESKPLDVKTGSYDTDFITFDFAGRHGRLLEAAGRVTIDVLGFFYVSGNFAFTKKTETVTLYDTEKGKSGQEVEVDLFTVGASKVNAFAGQNGPYWTDLDGSGDLSWVDENNNTLDRSVANTNHDGIVDPDETEELSEEAVGFALAEVNFALAVMRAHKPTGPPPVYHPAHVTMVSPGPNNDITYTARKAGPYFNDVTVEYVNGTALKATYNATTRKFTVTVVPGVTKAADIISYMENNKFFIATAAEARTDGVINTKAGPTELTVHPQVLFTGPGRHDDLFFIAKTPDPQFDGKTITLKSEPGISETIEIDYNETDKSLTVKLKNNTITAAMVRDAVNNASHIPYTVFLDTTTDIGNDGTGTVVAASKTTSTDPVRTSGRMVSPGSNNDLTIIPTSAGIQIADVTVEYVNGLADAANYTDDGTTKKLTITVVPGKTTPVRIIDVLKASKTGFEAVAAEAGDRGVINTAAGFTGKTGNGPGTLRNAIVTVKSPGPNNDLRFTAITPGPEYNHVTVEYVGGTELGVVYNNEDSTDKRLTITIVPGTTTAAQVIGVLVGTPFTAAAAETGTGGFVDISSASTGTTGNSVAAAEAAHATIKLNGPDNDLTFTATTPGAAFNGVTIKYEQGSEVNAVYYGPTKTLTITVKPGETTAAEVIKQLESVLEFSAHPAEKDTNGIILLASGAIQASGSTGTTSSDGNFAEVTVKAAGTNNDLTFKATTAGDAFNGVAVSYVSGDQADAVYDPSGKTLTITVVQDVTTAEDVKSLLASKVPDFEADPAEEATNGKIIPASGSTGSTGSDANFARVIVKSPGPNNDLKFTAKSAGPAFNNVAIRYVNGTIEGALYDILTNTLTITVKPGVTTAANVIAKMLTVSEFIAAPAEGDASGVINTSPASTGLTGFDPGTAHAILTIGGNKNDLYFIARTSDPQYVGNTISLEVVDMLGPDVNPDVKVLPTYAGDTLAIKVKKDTVNPVTATMVRDAVNNAADIPFYAGLDTTNDADNDGSGTVTEPTSPDPPLTRTTTPFGKSAKASVTVESPGPNNDLIFTAKTDDPAFNMATVKYVEALGAVPPVTVNYNAVTKILTIPITPGVTTAAQVMVKMNSVPQFTVTPSEGGTSGVINTASKTTGATGGVADLSGLQDDKRFWLSLKASVEFTEVVGVPGMTLRAEDLTVAINTGGGRLVPAIGLPPPDPTPGAPPIIGNPTVVDYEETPLDVRTGPGETDFVTLDFKGSNGKMLEASGSMTIDMFGFFYVSGNFALTLKTESVLLYDTATQTAHQNETTVSVLTLGASNVTAFAGVNGPYWTDMDNSGDISWVDETGTPMEPAIADLDADGIVDPDETAELSESATGLSLENVNFALAVMSPKTLPEDYTPATLPSAHVTIRSPGTDNDLTFTAATPGSTFNNVTVEYVVGTEIGAEYNKKAKKLTVTIVPGFTTALDIIGIMQGVEEFTATLAEGDGNGVIDATASASTATTGGTLSGIPKDKRKWIALKASVGGVEFKGLDDLTVRAEDFMVTISQRVGRIDGAPIYDNTASVDFETTPITVKTGSGENDKIVFDFPGYTGNLLEASGRVSLNVLGFFYVSGNFAFVKKTEKVRLYDTATGTQDQVETEVDLLSVGVSKVNAFAGVNRPYWIDLDGDEDISWVDQYGRSLTPEEADTNHNGIVDPDESYELRETAVGMALADVNFALALMAPRPPPKPKTRNQAHVTVISPGPNNDITFIAKNAGPDYNDVTVEYVNGTKLGGKIGELEKTLTITVVPGVTTAADVITHMESNPLFVATPPFFATAAEADTNGIINTAPASTGFSGIDQGTAHTVLTMDGPDNNLLFVAKTPDPQYDGNTISLSGF